jgi:hypothetical protein
VARALDDDDRLAEGDAAGDARELPRVADGFEVEQRDVGLRVVVPVLEHVVAGDVGAVAGGDEAGEADAALVEPGEDADADGAGLGEQADAAAGGHLGREGGVEAHVRVGVHQPEGVRADDAGAVRTGQPDEFALLVAAEVGGEDDESAHARLAALAGQSVHLVRGDGDDGEVESLGHLVHGAVGGHAADLAALALRLTRPVLAPVPALVLGEPSVDRVHPSGETAGAQALQNAAARTARRAARADHRDRAGREQPLHGGALGALFTGAHDGDGALGRFQIEGEVHGAVLETAVLRIARVREHLDHLAVGGQHVGGEALDAAFAGDGGDVLQEGGGHATALLVVADEEGHLCLGRLAIG